MLTKGTQLVFFPAVKEIAAQPSYTVCQPDPTTPPPPPPAGGGDVVCEYVNVLVGYWTPAEVALQPGHRVGEPKYAVYGPYCRRVGS